MSDKINKEKCDNKKFKPELEKAAAELIKAATNYLNQVENIEAPKALEKLTLETIENGNISINFYFSVNLATNMASTNQGHPINIAAITKIGEKSK